MKTLESLTELERIVLREALDRYANVETLPTHQVLRERLCIHREIARDLSLRLT